MMQRFVLSVFSCGFLLFAGYGHAENSAAPDQLLAKIDGSSITVHSFKAEMEKRGHGLPGRFASREQMAGLLNDMVQDELVYVAAIKAGYDKNPEIAEALKRMIEGKFREDNLGPELSKISVTDGEIETYYSANASLFSEPETVRAAVIYINVPEKASVEKKAELLQRAEEARTGALKLDSSVRSFGGLAVKYSDDKATRYRGGDTGLLKRTVQSRWPKELHDAIFSSAKPGEVGPLITGPDGYYVVKLIERNQTSIRPVGDVREMIRTYIFQDKKMKVEREFFDKLKKETEVSVNNVLLESITPPGALLPEPPALPGGGRTRK